MNKPVLALLACCGVVTAALLLLVRPAMPQSPTQPKITWTSPSYQVSLFPGTVKSTDLTFISSKPISNLSVFISPSISELLSIGSPGNGGLPGGQMATLHATLSASALVSPGTYSGTVHIRSGSATIAEPLEVDIQVIPPSANVVPAGIVGPSSDRITTTSDGAAVVRDEIDVLLKQGTPSPDQRIEQIAAQTGGVLLGSDSDLLIYQLQYKVGSLDELEQIRSALAGIQDVQAATLVPLGKTSLIPPNDPLAWGPTAPTLNRWGLEYIRALSAWGIQTGSRTVVVGVIDVDIDAQHSDLKDNIQSFSGPQTPYNGHGTHVAGIIGAVGNNGIGIAGTTWQTSLRLYDYQSIAPAAVQVAVIMKQAASDGSRIVNISTGWPGNLQCGVPPTAVDLQFRDAAAVFFGAAIQWAQRHGKDVLWVFSAGNACQDATIESPANLVLSFPQNVITVASVGTNGLLSAFSNRGSAVSVSAPGEQILSTLPRSCFLFVFCTDNYGFLSGTSQAAPHVAGLAALVLSAHPTFKASDLKQCIVSAAQAFGLPVGSGETFRTITAPEAVACAFGGSNWTEKFPATSPPARVGHAMAYDAAHNASLIFGGFGPGTGLNYLGDTWLWDGTNWTQAFPATSPPHTDRAFDVMAFDAARGKIVLFGGACLSCSPQELGDTWLWDGTNWSQGPGIGPGPRFGASMAYDAASKQVVLFGGRNSSLAVDTYFNDTWLWDGTTWMQAVSAAKPPPRNIHAMTYDSAHNQLVLFGGDTNSPTCCQFLNDTWVR